MSVVKVRGFGGTGTRGDLSGIEGERKIRQVERKGLRIERRMTGREELLLWSLIVVWIRHSRKAREDWRVIA